jgi:hypothetical protein
MKRITALSSIAPPVLLSGVLLFRPAPARAEDDVSTQPYEPGATLRVVDAADAAGHDPIAHAQKRLDRLKLHLGITAAQETRWSAFSASVLQQLEQFKAEQAAMAGTQTLTAPERIDRQIERMKQHLAGFEAMAPSASRSAVRDPQPRAWLTQIRTASSLVANIPAGGPVATGLSP